MSSHVKNNSTLTQSLRWRSIGPFRGGRASAVVGHPSEPTVFYMGCDGGVWKTDDAGAHWENISDGFMETIGLLLGQSISYSGSFHIIVN